MSSMDPEHARAGAHDSLPIPIGCGMLSRTDEHEGSRI